ncbi:flagellar basal-body rod protein FlgG [Chthonobacter rhizosphaerae]|uniref:flagellar basal-body rod protein FlgG n=1 Tax=Chthonobacter rhizosphaerae TaxID=2735553 RepID=UPI0015EFCA40|nr:flagellar basal-body rod protein FlgG [Chthonobacter rhizosphaerae]
MRSLAIAATGMSAQQTNVEVIANNIANINTTAFKRAQAEFSDLIYQTERLQGVPNRGSDSQVPEGAQIGLGTRTVAIRSLHRQGSLAQTDNTLDVALDGRGWFQVVGPDGEMLYTRAGSFNTSDGGQIVTADGYQVDPAIVLPPDSVGVTINEDGRVFARFSDGRQPVDVGQFNLALFANDTGLEALGGNLFRETTASGPPIGGFGGDPGFGRIRQGFKESSNVDPVKEITELITAQRAYEMNSKVIQASDEMAAVVTKGLR